MKRVALALLVLVGCKSNPGKEASESAAATHDTCANKEQWSAWYERLRAAAERRSGEGPPEHQARVRKLEEEGQSLARAGGCTDVVNAWQTFFDSNPGNRSEARAALVASFASCDCIERGATLPHAVVPAGGSSGGTGVNEFSPPGAP